MRALPVLEPYALKIRNGQCIPHLRHWVSLARLVGIPDHTEYTLANRLGVLKPTWIISEWHVARNRR